jgi:hypothetical protein
MLKPFAEKHPGGQLLRSGSSPALNYGEAQSAESKKDLRTLDRRLTIFDFLGMNKSKIKSHKS